MGLDFPAMSQKPEFERSLVALLDPPSHLLGQDGSSQRCRLQPAM